MIKLTTNDKKLLKSAHIDWPDPSALEVAYEQVLVRNRALLVERNNLLAIHRRLIARGDRWQFRCLLVTAISLAVVGCCAIWAFFLKGAF